VSARALADEPAGAASEDEVRRSALYREGVEFANARQWAEAVERFRQVVAIREAAPALYTLAQAEEHIGELASAERNYEKALAAARAAGIADVADAAARALSAIEPRVPRLAIRVSRGVDHATATIDGVAAPIGEAVNVDPGDRVVSVSAPGREPFRWVGRIVEGQSREVHATLDPISPPVAPARAAEPSPQGGGHASVPILPLVLGAAGVVAAATGMGLRLGGQSRYDGASAGCAEGVCANQSDVDRGNAGRTEVIWGTVVLGAGGAAVAGATALWFFMPRSPSGGQAGVRVSVLPCRDGAGASVSGRF
jgi:hypothetical protein